MDAVWTCQICGRPIKAGSGLIAHHGYKRPGHGWQTGSCPGTNFLPYEQSCDRLREIIEEVKVLIASEEEDLAAFLAAPPDIITVYERRSSWGQEEKKEYQKPEDFDKNNYYAYGRRTYEYAYDNKKNEYEQRIRMAQSDLSFMEKRLEDWRPV